MLMSTASNKLRVFIGIQDDYVFQLVRIKLCVQLPRFDLVPLERSLARYACFILSYFTISYSECHAS